MAVGALGKAGGRRQRGVLKAGMILIDPRIDDADFDAGARIRRTADRAPGRLRIDQAGRPVEIRLQVRQRHHVRHAGDIAQLERRLPRRRNEDRIDQHLPRAGHTDLAALQFG